MTPNIKIYHIGELIRKTESGEIDFQRSIQIVRELAMAAAFHEDSNILVDLRNTRLAYDNMSDTMNVALEIAAYKNLFKNKIATVIPNEPERIAHAEKFEAALIIRDFNYRFFTDFEDAIEWLSDVKHGIF
ncbi:MAG: STAS/SEC14 domain-containing protein [Desulfobacterales bacterium]|jgi:anti-anti-sigma regulatory factor